MFMLSDLSSGVTQISNQFHRFGCVSELPYSDIQLSYHGAKLRTQVSVTFEGYGVMCCSKVIYGIVVFHLLVNTVLLRTLLWRYCSILFFCCVTFVFLVIFVAVSLATDWVQWWYYALWLGKFYHRSWWIFLLATMLPRPIGHDPVCIFGRLLDPFLSWPPLVGSHIWLDQCIRRALGQKFLQLKFLFTC